MCSVNKRVCVKESKPKPLKYLTPGCLIEKAGFLSEDVCSVSCPLLTLPHCPQCWTLIRLPSDTLIVTLLLFPSFYPTAHTSTLLLHPFLNGPLASSVLHSPNTQTHTLTQFLKIPWIYFSLFSHNVYIWKFIYPSVHSYVKPLVICMVMRSFVIIITK